MYSYQACHGSLASAEIRSFGSEDHMMHYYKVKCAIERCEGVISGHQDRDLNLPSLQTTPLPEEAPDVAQRFTKKDVSSSLRNSESGMIDQVMVTTNVDGQRFVKVKVSPE